MANLVGDSGDASSNLVHGAGTNTVTFTMPDTVALNVESVYATVDNSGGGDTSAKLTVRDPSGQVIATKTQGDTIDAGATGSATFALRLSDEQNKRLATFGELDRLSCNPTLINAGASGDPDWTHFAGDTLVDLTNPAVPVILKDGIYALSAWVHTFPSPPAATTGFFTTTMYMSGPMDGGIGVPKEQIATTVIPAGVQYAYDSLAGTWRVEAGATLIMQFISALSGNRYFEFIAELQKLA